MLTKDQIRKALKETFENIRELEADTEYYDQFDRKMEKQCVNAVLNGVAYEG